MSTPTAVYDAYKTIVSSTLPSYVRIPNGLDVANAASIIRCNGFAVTPADGFNTERFVGCKASFLRNYTVTLVTQFTATENNAESIDLIFTGLMEDGLTLIKAVEKSTVLNDSSQGLGISKFTDDSGIFFVTGEREKYLQLDLNFETEYFVEL